MISPAEPSRSRVVLLELPPIASVELGLVIVSPLPPDPQADPVPVSSPATDSTHCVVPPKPVSVMLVDAVTVVGVMAPSVNVMAGVVVAVATLPDTPLAGVTETVVTVPDPACEPQVALLQV